MKISKWITLTEEVAVNMEHNLFNPKEELSLDQWLELLYESLMMHEHENE